MNKEINSGINKIVMTVFTQAIILILSIITGFILPNKLGPEMYGYWQIYIFYLSYVNLFGLGFNDGIALFYSGYDYNKLPFERLRISIRLFLVYLVIITFILIGAFMFIRNSIYRDIYQMLAYNIPFVCIQCLILTVFLSTNRTAIYNSVNLITKTLATAFYIILLYLGFNTSYPMMYADLSSRIIMTIICIILGKLFIFGKQIAPVKVGIQEFAEKSRSGIKITLAVIISAFIPVFGRIVVEWSEPIGTYGIYSFAITLLTIVISFTNTAGTVFFPILKQLSPERMIKYYTKFSFSCDIMIFICLLAYLPLLFIVQSWMPKYVPVLEYLNYMLAMCLPLGRIQLLLTPYYKAMRMEKEFLVSNVFGLTSMVIITVVINKLLHSVIAIAISSVFALMLWTIVTEHYLVKKKEIGYRISSSIIHIIMMTCFIFAGSFKSVELFAFIYVGSLLAYCYYYRKNIHEIIRQIKNS